MPSDCCIVVSCEHAGNKVPQAYQRLFRSAAARRVLASHRGWDPGSLTIGRRLATAFDAPLVVNPVTRLLVEVNRSPGHRQLFSEFSRELSPEERQSILRTIYDPHRMRVHAAVRAALRRNTVALHIGSHSFASSMNGELRHADVGLLYDPRRTAEQAFCTRWQAALTSVTPDVRVRRNYPYLGKADGLTTHLRRHVNTPRYLGIELEVNQRYLHPSMRRQWSVIQRAIVRSLQIAIQ